MVVLILGMVVPAVQQVMAQFLLTHKEIREKMQLLNQAGFAMDRITAFIRETDYIEYPAVGATDDQLGMAEHLLDMYNNTTHAFVAAGDGILDADSDANGRVNDSPGPGGADPPDILKLQLNKTDPDNLKLVEILPDYSTAPLSDSFTQRVVCENVTQFSCTTLTANLLEIQLVLEKGINRVNLKTRALAGRIVP